MKMINTSAVYDDHICLQVSNCNGDDFIRRQVSLRASRSGSRHEVIWTLPERLVIAAGDIVMQEILTEFQERFPNEP